MRWMKKPTALNGARRVRVFFAWLPHRIGLEVRWLEVVRVEEEYSSGWDWAEWNGIRFLSDNACPAHNGSCEEIQ
jgi:hypothetical protein